MSMSAASGARRANRGYESIASASSSRVAESLLPLRRQALEVALLKLSLLSWVPRTLHPSLTRSLVS
jgi:hypothetical protein